MASSVTSGTDTSDINHLKQGIYAHGPFERRSFLPIIGPEVDGFFLSQSVFGQSKTYSESTVFADLEAFNPVTYINSSGSRLYPDSEKNVDLRTPNQSDGIFEPFTIRKNIARTSVDTFLAEHSVKGNVQDGNENVNGKTDAINQFYESGRITEYETRTPIDTTYRALVKSDTPIYYWPLDDLLSTAVADVGTVNLAPVSEIFAPTPQSSGLTGKSFSFNGTLAYLTSNANINLTSYTRAVIEALIYVQAHDGSERTCWEFANAPDMFASSGTFRFDLDGYPTPATPNEAALVSGSVGTTAGYNNRIAASSWVHVAVVYDLSLPGVDETQVYHDGILQTRTVSSTSENSGLLGSYPLTLGSKVAHTENANFKMQHLAIYGGSSFTATKILQHSNAAHAILPPRKIKSFNPYDDEEVSNEVKKIIAFSDTSDDSFDMLGVTLTGEEIKSALRAMSPDTDNFIPQDHRSSGAGSTYDNNPVGTDSIAYGGLKR